MNRIETPWKGLAKFSFFLFGIPFSIAGLIVIVANGNIAFLVNGLIWLFFGTGLKIKDSINNSKLERLRKEGILLEGSVVKIIPYPWIKIGSYVTSRVECSYTTESGDRYLKSGYHLLLPFDKKENLSVKIYFDSDDSTVYTVELYREKNLL